MEMTPLDCPSCGSTNDPVGIAGDAIQYRCRACGMVYYAPDECAEDLKRTDIPDSAVEEPTDWEMSSPTD